MSKPGLTIIPGRGPSLAEIKRRLEVLADLDLLVGVPSDHTERKASDDEPQGLTNAALAYIHDQGAPEQNIPQREFMRPGVEAIQSEIQRRLVKMARTAVVDGVDQMASQATALGLRAKTSIQNKINEGIPPPLAEATLRQRAAKGRKGAVAELKARQAGEAPGTTLAKPLIDTAQLRNSINYVLRSKKGGA